MSCANPFRARPRWPLPVATLAALVWLWTPLRGQFSVSGGFRWPIYPETPASESDAGNRLRALITGASAQMISNSVLLVTQMRIDHMPDGTTNLVARAPQCLLSQVQRLAGSTNRLEVEVGQGQILISGRGFLCNLTNFNLAISNDVETIIRQDLIQSARRAKPLSGTTTELPSLLPPGPSLSTNEIRISSEQLNLETLSNKVVFTGHVKIRGAQLDLLCDVLTIRRATNGSIESILAENNVAILSKQDGSTARGGRALYSLSEGAESLSLVGQPAEWEDGWRRAEASRFLFDLKKNTLRAFGNAHIQLPRATLSQSTWPLSPAPTLASPTSKLLIVAADFLHVQFPTAEQPTRSVLARTNVLILNQEDGSRAASQEASLSEATGTLQLTGQASYTSDQRRIRGETLFLDRTNETFYASENAYLWLPVSSLNRRGNPPIAAPTTNFPGILANQFIEVFADRYDYQPGTLHFHGNVHGRVLEDDLLRGQISCQSVTLYFSNRLDRIIADDQVLLQQSPTPAPNCQSLERTLRCASLTILVGTNGQVDRIIAHTNVAISQIELPVDEPNPLTTLLQAQRVTAFFGIETNRLEQVIAEEQVHIRQGPRHAAGQQAIYFGDRNTVELSGNPTAEAPEGRITEAEVLLWDRTLNKFTVRKAKAQGGPLSGSSSGRSPLLKP